MGMARVDNGVIHGLANVVKSVSKLKMFVVVFVDQMSIIIYASVPFHYGKQQTRRRR